MLYPQKRRFCCCFSVAGVTTSSYEACELNFCLMQCTVGGRATKECQGVRATEGPQGVRPTKVPQGAFSCEIVCEFFCELV